MAKAVKHVPGRLAKEKLSLLAIPAAIPLLAILEAAVPSISEYVNVAIHLTAAASSIVIAYALVLRK